MRESGWAGLVSVVMPVYNSSEFLRQSIQSVLCQTYDKWCLIIVDDCSTDDSFDIAREAASNDSRIIVLRNEKNRGVSYSRNRAIAASTGTWVAFLDSDDLWEPCKLELQLDCALRNDSSFVFSGTAYINASGRRSSFELKPPYRVSFDELLKQNVISCSSALLKRELLLGVEAPGDESHEDFAMWLSVLRKVDYAYAVTEPCTIHRLRVGSKSSNKASAFFMNLNTYKFAGVAPLKALSSTLSYVVRNAKKYRLINEGFAGSESI